MLKANINLGPCSVLFKFIIGDNETWGGGKELENIIYNIIVITLTVIFYLLNQKLLVE